MLSQCIVQKVEGVCAGLGEGGCDIQEGGNGQEAI